jgi:hypothetical protein
MNEKIVEKLSKLLRGETDGSFSEQILSEIYSEVNQLRQKQDEMVRLLLEWRAKQKLL